MCWCFLTHTVKSTIIGYHRYLVCSCCKVDLLVWNKLNRNFHLADAMGDDYRTVVIPTIDVISNDTFEYKRQYFPSEVAGRGALNLNFKYTFLPMLLSAFLNPSKPFETPIMASGFFAINADYFWELRAFDKGLSTYGELMDCNTLI